MRSLSDREQALKLYFEDGESYTCVSKKLGIPLDTVKSWCLRYRKKMGLPQRNKAGRPKGSVKPEYIHNKIPKTDSPEDRIARLEMEVDLLRNFLILQEGR